MFRTFVLAGCLVALTAGVEPSRDVLAQEVGHVWFLTNVKVEDDGDPKTNLLQGAYEPIVLKTADNVTKVKERKIMIHVELAQFPNPPKEWCKEKPKEVRIRVRYDVAEDAARNYYLRPENKLKEDPFVFDKTVEFKANVAEAKWDGRDTGEAQRLIVRGDETKYYFEFTALACGHPLMVGGQRGLPPMVVKAPHATAAGHAYPPDYYATVIQGVPREDPGAVDGYDPVEGEPASGVAGAASRLAELGPGGAGYDAGDLKNKPAGVILGYWEGSAYAST